jgi:hypothetical protein
MNTTLDNTPTIGSPATYRSGSDTYAYIVTGLTRFKTGKRAEEVKSVTIARVVEYDIEARDASGSVDVSHPSVVVSDFDRLFTLRNDNHFREAGTDHGRLSFGIARDYLDPSF